RSPYHRDHLGERRAPWRYSAVGIRLGSRLRGDSVARREREAMSTELDWFHLRRRLQILMRSVGEEISAYPRPITACDAQFNHLLELRGLLPAELARLEAAAADPAASVEVFVRASPCGELLSAAEAAGGESRG